MLDFLIKYWLEVLFGVLMAIGGVIMKRFDQKLKEYKATEKGVEALLRNGIIQVYDMAMKNKYLKIYERENVQHMFEEYTALGGNGVIPGLVERMYQLPTEPQENEGE